VRAQGVVDAALQLREGHQGNEMVAANSASRKHGAAQRPVAARTALRPAQEGRRPMQRALLEQMRALTVVARLRDRGRRSEARSQPGNSPPGLKGVGWFL
jgi:hypothetical protein